MRVARAVILNPEQRQQLEQQSRARSLPARQVERARVVLRAADGRQDKDIASELGITPEKAARWRNRFLDGGLAALQRDAPRQADRTRSRLTRCRKSCPRRRRRSQLRLLTGVRARWPWPLV